MTFLVLTALLAASPPAPLQGELSSEQLREQTEARVRTDVSELLGKLCGDKCFVLGVTARVEDVTEGPDEPGFEQVAKKHTVPTVRSCAVSVVAAESLPPDFRARLKPLVTQRVKPVAPQVSVTLEVVSLPSEQQLQPVVPAEAPIAKEPAPEQPWSWRAALGKRLVDSAPLLLAALFFALAIVSAAIVLRPRTEKTREASREPVSTLAPAPTEPLRRALPDDRVARNRVVREALAAREWELLSAWHSVFGEALFDDARGQLPQQELFELRSALERIPARVEEAARIFDARMTAAKLSTSVDPAARSFDFLESVAESAFVSATSSLPATHRSLALRFAPAHLRKAAFRALTAADRAALVLSWSASPAVPLDLARAASTSLKNAIDQLGGGASPEDAVEELLFPLSRSEQDALVATLGANAGTAAHFSESWIERATPDALTTAVSQLPPVRLASYLAGADAALSARVLSACSPSVRTEVQQELDQHKSKASDFHAARAELLRNLRGTLERRGQS